MQLSLLETPNGALEAAVSKPVFGIQASYVCIGLDMSWYPHSRCPYDALKTADVCLLYRGFRSSGQKNSFFTLECPILNFKQQHSDFLPVWCEFIEQAATYAEGITGNKYPITLEALNSAVTTAWQGETRKIIVNYSS